MAIDENGNTDLMQAVLARNIAEITRLCNILTKEEKEAVNNEGYTALMLAAEQNYPTAIIALRANGANVNAVDNRGYTAAMIAAEEDYADAIEALTEDMFTEEGENLGADLEYTDDTGYNAVMIAAKYNNIKALEALIANDADVDARTIDEDGGLTALIISLQENNTEAAELLIGCGASVAASYDGLTPLMCASANGNVRIMKLLNTKNVDLNAVSEIGESALLAAVGAEKSEAVKLILAKGAKIADSLHDIVVTNQEIINLLYTAEIVDAIFTGKAFSEKMADFVNNNLFDQEIVAQRFISLCIVNAEGRGVSQQIDSAGRLFQDKFESWFSSMGEMANLSEAINQLIADGLSLRHQQIIGNLFRISESLYEAAVGELYEKMNQVYIILPLKDNYIEENVSRKRNPYSLVRTKKIQRKAYEDDESESSTEIDENNEESKSDTAPRSNNFSNTQVVQQEDSSGINTDEKEETENSNIVEAEIEDNPEFNTWIETIFAGWGGMPQWIQDNIINSSPMQAILKSLAGKKVIYNPKSIEDKFAEIFVIEKRDDSLESIKDNINEKATYAKVFSDGIDTSLIYNALKVGICILPMVEGSGILGEVLGRFGVEVV